MGQVYLDFDALRDMRATISSLCNRLDEEAQRHSRLGDNLCVILQQVAGGLLHEVESGQMFDPGSHWETLGLGRAAWECATSQQVVEGVAGQARTALQQLQAAHGTFVGNLLSSRAQPYLQALSLPTGAISDLLADFSPRNLLAFLRDPWGLRERFMRVKSTISSASDSLLGLSAYLERVERSGEALVVYIEANTSIDINAARTWLATQTQVQRAPNLAGPSQSLQGAASVNDWERGFDYSFRHGDYPIRIGTATGPNGQKAIVMQLLGVEPNKIDQANTLLFAFLLGLGVTTNPNAIQAMLNTVSPGSGPVFDPYFADIQTALNTYMKDHHLAHDTPIILEGHSMGGMEAQKVAADSSFNVAAVFGYGSPNLGLPHGNAREYDLYANQYDVVPHLSRYEALVIPQALGAAGVDWVTHGTFDVSSRFYSFSGMREFYGGVPYSGSPVQMWNDILRNHSYRPDDNLSQAANFKIQAIYNTSYYSAPIAPL